MFLKLLITSIIHYKYIFIINLYGLGVSIYYLNLIRCLYKSNIILTIKKENYFNFGFFIGIFVGSILNKDKSYLFIKELFNV